LGALGLLARTRRSWTVLVVPLAFLVVLWAVDTIGEYSIHWFLNWGY
jgi:hypothetical protein